MAIGVSESHTSVPRDGVPIADGGVLHLVVCASADARIRELTAGIERAGGTAELLCGGETPEAALRERLERATVGLRLHLLGSEGFVRRTSAIASAAGLLPDEIATEVSGSRARRVRCVHCTAIAEDVATSVTPCAGCGRMLVVYHHFSRRHGAFMGYQVDAEAPGELPEVERPWD